MPSRTLSERPSAVSMKYFIVVASFCLFVIVPQLVTASVIDDYKSSINTTATKAGIQDSSFSSPQEVAGKVARQVVSLVGVIFLVLMIWAGTLWMTAGGNQERIDEARKIIIAAVIGLILVAMAYAITRFVGQTLLNGSSNV